MSQVEDFSFLVLCRFGSSGRWPRRPSPVVQQSRTWVVLQWTALWWGLGHDTRRRSLQEAPQASQWQSTMEVDVHLLLLMSQGYPSGHQGCGWAQILPARDTACYSHQHTQHGHWVPQSGEFSHGGKHYHSLFSLFVKGVSKWVWRSGIN
jgi:hypothetical protein